MPPVASLILRLLVFAAAAAECAQSPLLFQIDALALQLASDDAALLQASSLAASYAPSPYIPLPASSGASAAALASSPLCPINFLYAVPPSGVPGHLLNATATIVNSSPASSILFWQVSFYFQGGELLQVR